MLLNIKSTFYIRFFLFHLIQLIPQKNPIHVQLRMNCSFRRVKQSLYRDNDYDLGQLSHTLRNTKRLIPVVEDVGLFKRSRTIW